MVSASHHFCVLRLTFLIAFRPSDWHSRALKPSLRIATSKALRLIVLLASASTCIAQNPLATKDTSLRTSTIEIPHLAAKPTLSDFEDMQPRTALARSMRHIENFIQRNPSNGSPASQRTEAYVGYTDRGLVVVFLCFDDNPSQIRAHMNRREDIQMDDQIGFFLDSFDDRKHAYTFYVNPLNVQQDATWLEGGNEPDMSFDTLWYSATRMLPQGYMAWFEIPFKSIRFPRSSSQHWGIFFERDIPRNNESSFYPFISADQQGFLTQEAQMTGIEQISPGRNLQFIPYGSFSSFRALDERDPAQARFSQRTAQFRGGLDAKAVLHDSLVLDVTANPDFAQVESDEPQSTVNQRFEVFFPEKRPFFQENSGYFDTPVTTLFTRRIIDPTFGIRLTGKVGRWAIGTLFADDRSPGKSVLDSDPLHDHRAYFGVLRISHDIGKNSRIGVVYTDRELDTTTATSCTLSRCLVATNRVGGIDGLWKISGKWVAIGQALTSSTDYADGTHLGGPSYNLYVERSSYKSEFNTLYQDTSPGFYTASGFFRRPDVRRFSNFYQYRFRKEGKPLIWHGPSVSTLNIWDHKGQRIEYFANLNYRFNFRRQSNFGVYANLGHERLRPEDFAALSINKDYARNQKGFFFNFGYWKWLNLSAEANWGNDTNYDPRVGPPVIARSNWVWTTASVRPIRGLSIDNTYLLTRLADINTGANIFNAHIIRSKWNYQFTNALSLRVITQYEATLANPLLSALPADKNLNADVLFTYLVHPGTAVYVGYNSNLHNYDRYLGQNADGLIRTPNYLINDGRQVFVKISYLFRY